MVVAQEKADGKTIVHLDGRFDFGARTTFKAAMDQAFEEGSPVVLDLEKVTFVDSSAFGLLVICYQKFKNKNILLYLVNPQIYVKQVLVLANIEKMIPIFQTLAEVPKRSEVPTGEPA